MLIDSLNFISGAVLQNAVIESGSALPSGSPAAGTIFYKTGADAGLYFNNGSTWDLVMSGTSGDTTFVNVGGDTLTGPLTLAGAPTQNLHAATKAYVDTALGNAASGLDFKDSVRFRAVGPTKYGLDLNGTPLSIGDRILVIAANEVESGIYVASASNWPRADDFVNGKVSGGAYVYVEDGTYAGTGWVVTNAGPVTVGTTSITFAKINSTSPVVIPPVPYDVATYVSGTPAVSEKLMAMKVVTAFTIPANFAGSVAVSTTAATASSTINILKNGASVGSITFAAAGTSGTFGTVAAVSFAVGDVLLVQAPAIADATLADIMITLHGTVA